MTVAAFMDLALYHPEFGYYARAARRSGRAGDFFTSVDVGPLFGELLERQIREMFDSVEGRDLVEVGAGSGRLAADILRAARENDLPFYQSIRLHLVEASGAARGEQRATLGDLAERLVSSTDAVPGSFEGVLIANELLDAMPVHQVVMRDDGLREVYVGIRDDVARPFPPSRNASADHRSLGEGGQGRDQLALQDGPLSTPALADYLDRLGITLERGWRVEISLSAVQWVRDAARKLRRGFMILIDYGHEARELYSASHSAGTLTTFSAHRAAGPESDAAPWLADPGERDITTHVDFTSVRAAAEAEGMTTLGFLDQTYFLLGLAEAANFANANPAKPASQLKTLILPGGLGSTMKVLILGKNVGTPSLRGCSFKVRVT